MLPKMGAAPSLLNAFAFVSSTEPWSHPSESNRQPSDYKSDALPVELGWRRFARHSIPGLGINVQFASLARPLK